MRNRPSSGAGAFACRGSAARDSLHARPSLAAAKRSAHDTALDLKRAVSNQRYMPGIAFAVDNIDNRTGPLRALWFHIVKNLPADHRILGTRGRSNETAQIVAAGPDRDRR